MKENTHNENNRNARMITLWVWYNGKKLIHEFAMILFRYFLFVEHIKQEDIGEFQKLIFILNHFDPWNKSFFI